jgi:hypothetical protein
MEWLPVGLAGATVGIEDLQTGLASQRCAFVTGRIMVRAARVGAGLLEGTKAEENGNIVTGTLESVAEIARYTLKGQNDVVP